MQNGTSSITLCRLHNKWTDKSACVCTLTGAPTPLPPNQKTLVRTHIKMAEREGLL